MKILSILILIASLTGCQTVTDETGTHRRYTGPGVSVAVELGGVDVGFSIAKPDTSK
jgi:uncharacterized protein YceK